jgi:hypothetical protein
MFEIIYTWQRLNQVEHISPNIYHFFMVKAFIILSSRFLKCIVHNYYL